MILRYFNDLSDILPDNKVLIIYGPRRVGKTTLVNLLMEKANLKYKIDSGDNIRTRNVLTSEDFQLIKEYAEGYELIIIDEAQNIPGIGQALKIMSDQIPKLKVIATGSSSFNMKQEVGEPLTGRKKEIILFPLSQIELNAYYNRYELKDQLDSLLVFGSYPEIYTTEKIKEKIELLQELVDSYLLKDILGFDRLKSPVQLINLLKLLAFQVGHEVSVNELAEKVGLNVRTVARYLELLEKGFVIYRLGAYSKNLRKEITKKSKYFFYDNGVRNGIIMQFNSLDMRNDKGQLWENFLMSERLKHLHYKKIFANRYFWRTYQQQELDYIEEINGKLYAYEYKFNKKEAKIPSGFQKAYEIEEFRTINKDNYLDFVI
jgi:predicted AAA+ superfamily ATPase